MERFVFSSRLIFCMSGIRSFACCSVSSDSDEELLMAKLLMASCVWYLRSMLGATVGGGCSRSKLTVFR